MKAWIPLLLVAGIACVPPAPRGLYDWGGYDTSLYALMKDPNKQEAFGEALRKEIERNPDGRRVPPGVYAEYGYILFVAGRKDDAARYFALEKTRWPESARIMDRMLANCAAPPPAQPASAPAAPAAPTVPAPEVR